MVLRSCWSSNSPSRRCSWRRRPAQLTGWPQRWLRSWGSKGLRVLRNPAGTIDVENDVEPAESDPRADAESQLDELVVGEGGVQPAPEGLVNVLVVEGVLLREL